MTAQNPGRTTSGDDEDVVVYKRDVSGGDRDVTLET